MYRKIAKLITLLFIPAFLIAGTLGPDVSQYRGEELKWEDGAYGYHVMFKTLLENLQADGDNPQADACTNESTGSTYTLDISHIPADSYVARAFLVWSGAVPVANVNDPTDNEVNLSYSSTDGTIAENQIIKGKKAYLTSESADFEFEGFKDLDDPTHSFFTYRVDVTDFFKSIHDKGRDLGLEYDGYSLFGDYNLSGLTCASDSSYLGTTDMVSGWSLVLIYTSTEISPKKIYFYDGFKAYWQEETEINVTGFEFPTEPEVRLTLITHEGDPNLVSLENPNGGPAIPEGLQVQGDQVGWLLISNVCNPEAQKSDGVNTLFYTEVYNSISSVYGWADVEPTCIGGTPPVWDFENIEYAMDVDTFVMDSSKDGSYASHFHKGGQRIGLKVGANKDQVITNMLIVSVDTKAPMFDIPGRDEKVSCTPANADGKWCENGEHTFAIRIQNWGDDITPPVMVKDTIPEGMEYVPGSTEYATDFETEGDQKVAKKWTRIPDLGDGGFPLASGFKVADTLNFCGADDDYLSCGDLIVVRFRATVKDIPKNAVIENVAMIDTTGFPTYRTNLGLPVKLTLEPSSCVTAAEDIDLGKCGGVGVGGCETDDDCGKFEICDPQEGICVDDPSIKACSDSSVTAEVGKNSPVSETIFISPQEGLVMGQIALTEASGGDCYYNLNQVVLKVKVDEPNIQLKNFKLVMDANGNGVYDPSAEVEEGEDVDSIVATTDNLNDGYASFSIPASSGRLFANKINNLLFIVDAGYKEGEKISRSATFLPSLENEGILIGDDGSAKLSGLPIDFSEFQFEPEDSFIVTKGMNDPAVPEKKDMNGTHDILQLKVASKTSEDTIKSLKVKLGKSDMASFGSGLKNISIWEDTDNDGKGDKEIAKASTTDSVQIHNFKDINFSVPADQEKYLTIRADLSLSDGEYFQLEVTTVGIDSDRDVLGLPVNSKEYNYVCDPLYEECGGGDGCAITAVSTTDSSNSFSWLMVSILIAVSAFFIEKSRKKVQ